MNQLISDQALCSTAPATPGLFKTCVGRSPTKSMLNFLTWLHKETQDHQLIACPWIIIN